MILPVDKRTSLAEAVAELRDGMTIGIGGWGSRRKPMAVVREILRTSLKDLTIVSYGGPDLGILCAAGRVKKACFGFVSLDSIPLEPHFRARAPERRDRDVRARRGDVPVGACTRRRRGCRSCRRARGSAPTC
jgi:glutaconate CoA-transferase subunit A